MSAANKDFLKLGQVLGADGLLMPIAEGTNQFMRVRLVVTKPGVVVASLRSAWPVKDIRGNNAAGQSKRPGPTQPTGPVRFRRSNEIT